MKTNDPLLEIEKAAESPGKSSRWFVLAMLSLGFCAGFAYQLVTMFADYSDSMKAVRQKVTSANEYLTKMTVDGTDSAVRFWTEMSDIRKASEKNREIQDIVGRNTQVNERLVTANKWLREEYLSLESDNARLMAENDALSWALEEKKAAYAQTLVDTEVLKEQKMGYFLKMDDVKRKMLEAMDRNTATGKRLKAKYFDRVSLMAPYYELSKQPASVEAMTQLCDSLTPVPEEKTLYCNVVDVGLKFVKLDSINFY